MRKERAMPYEPHKPGIWPKLSVTLTGEIRPDRCQSCGWDCDLARWQECDEFDHKTPTVVVLCLKCGQELIESHPRLYHRLSHYEPLPGSMALCGACRCRAGVSCTHPDLRANGGAGLRLTIAKPNVAFVCGRGSGGKQVGGQRTIWPAPASDCAGREVMP